MSQVCDPKDAYHQDGGGREWEGEPGGLERKKKKLQNLIKQSSSINLLKFTQEKLSKSLLVWKLWSQTLLDYRIKTTNEQVKRNTEIHQSTFTEWEKEKTQVVLKRYLRSLLQL